MLSNSTRPFRRFVVLCGAALAATLITGASLHSEPAATPLKVGLGWSTKSDASDAVAEALDMAKKRLGFDVPQCAILYMAGSYQPDRIFSELKARLGAGTKIFGGTSRGTIMTEEGVHSGDVGSVAIALLSSKGGAFGVAGGHFGRRGDGQSPREVAKRAACAAIADAGKPPAELQLPACLIVSISGGPSEEIIAGITDGVGPRVRIVGGNSPSGSTLETSGAPTAFSTAEPIYPGVSILAVYLDVPIGIALKAKHGDIVHKGTITKVSEKGKLEEIDGKMAARVYNDWTGGALNDLLKSGGYIDVGHQGMFSLLKAVDGPGGKKEYVSAYPAEVNLPGYSLTVVEPVKVGDELILIKGTPETMTGRTEDVFNEAFADAGITKDDAVFALEYLCLADMEVMPRGQWEVMGQLTRKILGTPFLAVLSGGEEGCIPGVGNVKSSRANAVVVFGAKH